MTDWPKTNPPIAFVDKLRDLTEACRILLNQFDELWVTGARSDHHKNLVDLGIINEDQIDLLYAHNHYGGSGVKRVLRAQRTNLADYASFLRTINPAFEHEVERIADSGRKVCILNPHPNTQLNRIIKEKNAEHNFFCTAPVNQSSRYVKLESKQGLTDLVSKACGENSTEVLLPCIVVSNACTSLNAIRYRLGLQNDEAVYLQQDLSVGGSGTALVRTQKDFDDLFTDTRWRRLREQAQLKATQEVRHAYPANGSACIIPTGYGQCNVYIDPLSHKPMDKEGGSTIFSSLGNEWRQQWPENIQEEYIKVTTLIGEELYRSWGYTGIFGPDFLVEKTPAGLHLRIVEINPRWQGTTPYNTYNALLAERLPLEIVHYVTKLDPNGLMIAQTLQLLGDPQAYNKTSVNSPGCFYLKIHAPKNPSVIQEDMNGYWEFNGKTLSNFRGADIFWLTDATNTATRIVIRAPKKGVSVGGESIAIAYIAGVGTSSVFLQEEPELARYGKNLRNSVEKRLYK